MPADRWAVVKKWSEQSRYLLWEEADASAMLNAVVGNGDEEGLLQWLTNRL